MSICDGRRSSRRWSPSGCSRSLGIPTRSISRLTAGTNLSRQAVTKHLRVLANAGVVRSIRVGRESLFELESRPIQAVRDYLDRVSKQWDDALARLKSHVEE